MDYYIQKGKIDEGLAQMDAVLAKNSTPYFMYVKGVLQYERKTTMVPSLHSTRLLPKVRIS